MSAQPARAYLGIGEVLAHLRAEFPDISVSKIRFLESEGLISPARSPSGYRKFAPADVERLRYILTAQRDRYLPLRVIKDQLDGAGDGQGRAGPHLLPAPPADGQSQPAPLTRRDLLGEAGIGEAELAELEAYGLVRRTGRHYPPAALHVIRAATALSGYGVQPRHLRALLASVERETALIEHVVAPLTRQRSPGARDRAGTAAREIAVLALRAHAALLQMALADAGFGDRDLGSPGP